jgi:hypothetical protein
MYSVLHERCLLVTVCQAGTIVLAEAVGNSRASESVRQGVGCLSAADLWRIGASECRKSFRKGFDLTVVRSALARLRCFCSSETPGGIPVSLESPHSGFRLLGWREWLKRGFLSLRNERRPNENERGCPNGLVYQGRISSESITYAIAFLD